MKNRGILIQAGPYTYNSRLCGAHRIAHYLRTEHDWDIEVVDFGWVWTSEQLEQFIDSRYNKNLKWIGLSMMFVDWQPRWESLFAYIKNKDSSIVTLWGSGSAPDFVSNNIDYYMYGFGEFAITALLKYLFSNGPRPILNLGDKHNRKIIDANNQYPAYPMRSLNIIYEDRDFITNNDSLTIETARGCKFSCAFCNFPVLGVKGDYTRDADDFEIQIRDAYDRFGVTRYHVADETFNDRTEKITKFADVVEKLDFDPWFSGYIRADLLVARELDKHELLRMNFTGQYYGIETFYQPSGKIIGKGYNADRLKQGLLDIKDFFRTNNNGIYRGVISLIAGLPGEKVESIRESIRWVQKNWKGEAAQVFALELAEGDLVKQSKLVADYQRFGYRRKDPSTKTNNQIQYANDLYKNFIDWESDITSRDECRSIGDEFAKDFVTDPDWKVGNWSVNSYAYLPLQEALQKPVYDLRGDAGVHHEKPVVKDILQTYISKKINWLA